MEELKKEATELGIDFKGVKSKVDMQKLIDAYYNEQSNDSDIPTAKVEETEEEEEKDETVSTPVKSNKKPISKEARIRFAIRDAKARAMKTRVVTITNNDKRDSHMTTTAYLSCENEYFGISRSVPLDVPIELEQCLIDVAVETKMVNHVDEIVNGRRTGNKVPKLTRKYAVSYENISIKK